MLAGGRKSRNPVSSFVSLVVWVAVLHVSCNWLATELLSTT